jgi:hypothetical protein
MSFHSGVVDVADLCNSHLLWTTWWMTNVALSDILLWSEALPSEVAHVTTIEAGVAEGGSGGR